MNNTGAKNEGKLKIVLTVLAKHTTLMLHAKDFNGSKATEDSKNVHSTTRQREYFSHPVQENTYTMQYLAELNEEAVHLINAESYEEALNWLNQAEEKISTLDKIAPNEETYIITVFYNIACCYQKVGQLQKWNAYLKLTIQLLKKLFANREDRKISK